MKTFIKKRPKLESFDTGLGGKAAKGAPMGTVDVDDGVITLAKFANGALGTFEATRFAAGRKNYNWFEVNGSKGSVVFNLETMNQLLYYNCGDPEDRQGFRVIQTTADCHPMMSHPMGGPRYWPVAHIIGYEHTFINTVADLMNSLADNLQQARQMMSGEMLRQAIQAMRKASRELLQLSQQQEQLMQQMQGMPRNSPQYMEMAEKQEQAASSLQRVVDGMAETMKNNFGIDPKVSRSLGKAMMEMENALRYLEERNSAKAAQSQGRSMAQMNAAVRGMQQSMQNMMQQGGSGGMSYQQFLQQMQQMADAQGQLNRQTQALGNPGQLTLGQQAALARLAAEQRQLRKSMEQLAGEAEGMSEILGSLEKIAEDMKKVEQDFADKQITRDTINRQNRILSRMLDAQKSVNKREFSRERKAETGKRYMAKSPDALPNDLGERKNQLQQDLLRAKKEGYSRDYLKVIENYFKALTEHERADQ